MQQTISFCLTSFFLFISVRLLHFQHVFSTTYYVCGYRFVRSLSRTKQKKQERKQQQINYENTKYKTETGTENNWRNYFVHILTVRTKFFGFCSDFLLDFFLLLTTYALLFCFHFYYR